MNFNTGDEHWGQEHWSDGTFLVIYPGFSELKAKRSAIC
jgi:hypothetical protein